jgi:hypothetical protein
MTAGAPTSRFGLAQLRRRFFDWRERPAPIHCEQAVYGSFDFWDRGYALLGRSPGLSESDTRAFIDRCRTLGEPSRRSHAWRAFFSQRLGPRSPWLVACAWSPGRDDRGRPDALAFHGIFIHDAEFARIDFDPFALRGSLRTDWGPRSPFESATLRIARPRHIEPPMAHEQVMVDQLVRGERVCVPARASRRGQRQDPLATAERIWSMLPRRARKRASIFAPAFRDLAAFQLVVLAVEPPSASNELGSHATMTAILSQDPDRRNP